MLIEGQSVRGDVEIHFRSKDWRAHGHHLDPSFSSVVLHVLLFPPKTGEAQAETLSGRFPMACALLEAMDCSLEEYAEEEAIKRLCGRDSTLFKDAFALLPSGDPADALKKFALDRWEAKIEMAVKRLHGTVWSELCHQVLLEILGYRRNRAPMSAIALHHPLREWSKNPPDPDQLFDSMRGDWKLAGLRPANHPRSRLRQYFQVVCHNPNWPQRVEEFSTLLHPDGESEETSRFRKEWKMPSAREVFGEKIFNGAFGAGRLNTLMVDGLLPLLAAKTGRDLFPWWFHWYAGDAPEALIHFLRELGLTAKRLRPLCNGWVQGGLGGLTARVACMDQIEY